jgi:CRISPR-associated protein Cmr3
VGLRLDPFDTLFFRDGRPFDAAARVIGGLPNPQTLAGALRTALLVRMGFPFREFAKHRKSLPLRAALDRCRDPKWDWVIDAHFRGPWLALAPAKQSVEPLLPQPITLTRRKGGGWLRSRPDEGLPGWSDPDNLLPLWRRGEPDSKAESGFLTLAAVREFLAGKDEVVASEFFPAGDLYGSDNRTGIALNMHTLTSEEGELYGIRLLALKGRVREGAEADPYRGAEVCLYGQILPGDQAPPQGQWFPEPVALGGEGRYVRVCLIPPCDWPAPDPAQRRSLWLLASPAFFPGRRSLPPVSAGATLRAAAAAAGVGISGWDVAHNGPRPTRFAVPAGAVYFVEGELNPTGQSLCADPEAAEGWGFALQGKWE